MGCYISINRKSQEKPILNKLLRKTETNMQHLTIHITKLQFSPLANAQAEKCRQTTQSTSIPMGPGGARVLESLRFYTRYRGECQQPSHSGTLIEYKINCEQFSATGKHVAGHFSWGSLTQVYGTSIMEVSKYIGLQVFAALN